MSCCVQDAEYMGGFVVDEEAAGRKGKHHNFPLQCLICDNGILM